jgi:hypothetical protein
MRLSKEKRDRLIVVAVATAVVCIGLWWSFINESNKALAKSRAEIAEVNESIERANKWIKRWEAGWSNDYTRALADLAVKEKDMVPEGKEMSFLSEAIERVRTNRPGRAIRFESISPAILKERMEAMPHFIRFVEPGSTNRQVEWIAKGNQVLLAPEFPYRRNASLSYKCQGCYHDFGLFLADLENTYPYMQFQVNEVKKAEQPKEGEDTLRFELKVVAMLRPPPPK